MAFSFTLSLLLILLLALVAYYVYHKIYKKSPTPPFGEALLSTATKPEPNRDRNKLQEGNLNHEEEEFKHQTPKSSNNSLVTDMTDGAQVPTQAEATPEREQVNNPLIVDRLIHEEDNPDGRGAAKGAALDDAATPLIQYEPGR